VRRASPLIFLLLTACGSSISIDPSGPPPEDLPPDSPPRACLADLARTSAPDWEPGHACDAASLGDDVGMFAMVRFELVGLTGAGTRLVHRFFEGQDVEKASALDEAVVVRGDYVAATVTRVPFGVAYGDPISAETVLLRRDGTLLQKHVEDGTWNSSGGLDGFFLSDRGMLVAGRSLGDDMLTYAARDTGLLATTGGVRPIAEPAPSGRVLVRNVDPLSSEVILSWFDPCSGELHPSRESARKIHWSFRTWGYRLVYPDDVDRTQLVIEDPEGSTSIDLGEEGELIEIHPAGHALLETAVPGRVLLADLNAHTARAVTIELPAGWTSMNSARPASDGRLYMPMRTSAVGALQVTTDGLSWAPVGLPIGEVYGAAARETNGTFYLYGNVNAVMIPPWDPPPPGVVRLDDNSVQVAREDGTSVVIADLPPGSSWLDDFRLATDGGCVSNGNDGGVEVTHTSSGTVMNVPLADPKTFDPAKASTFIPGDDMLPWY
jgi:hypothetical protein